MGEEVDAIERALSKSAVSRTIEQPGRRWPT
jgi:hypothetical protein